MSYFDEWLANHPHTDVVRLTTLAYHFAVDSDQNGADKFRDWVGYQDTVNIRRMDDIVSRRLTSMNASMSITNIRKAIP